jgi:hypothetical protein
MRQLSRPLLAVAILGLALSPAAAQSPRVEEKLLLDNAQVMIVEYVFPPGFENRVVSP